MSATKFDGAADKIVFGIGTCSSTGAHTIGAVFRRDTQVNGGINTWDAVIDGEGASAGTVRASLEGSDATGTANHLSYSNAATASNGSVTTAVGSATTWYGAAASKPAGTAVALLARRDLTTPAAIASENGVGTPTVNASQMTQIICGLWNGTDDFGGWLGVAFWFNGQLTLAQITECFANQRTSDIWNCTFGRPAGLWEFNGSSATDLTGGGANETSRVGTSLDAAEVPPWTFDGIGATSSGILVPRLPRSLGPRSAGPLYFAPRVVPGNALAAQSITVAQATETEVANAITPTKTGAVSQVTETEVANAVTPKKSRTVTQAVETEVANTITPTKARAVAQATEIETANTVSPTKARSVTQVVETETANAVTFVGSHTVAQATETETANAVTPTKSRSVSQAVETEVANAITPTKSRALTQAVETEAANAVTPTKSRAVTQASETEAANTLTPRKSLTVGQVIEVETANGVVRLAVGSDGAGLPVFTVGPTRTSRVTAKDTRTTLARGPTRTTYGRVDLLFLRVTGTPRLTRVRTIPRSTQQTNLARLTRVLGIATSKRTAGTVRLTRTLWTRSTTTRSPSTVSKQTRANIRMTLTGAKTVYSTDVYGQLRVTTGRVISRTTRVVR